MFSGIIEETGIVQKIDRKPNLSTLYIKAQKIIEDTQEGASISVGGVCLTVTKLLKDVLVFDIMLETIKKTTLGNLDVGSRVNLERALRMDSRISGHFVSGHVDRMEDIIDVITGENYTEIRTTIHADIKRYLVPKGSVCLDGVSLTVGEVREHDFSVYLIPYTLQVTTLGECKKGGKINIETDILAKYVLAQAGHATSPYSVQKEQLEKEGRLAAKNQAAHGNQPHGNQPHGNQPRGHHPQGNQPHGSQPPGNLPQGNQPKGNQPHANPPKGQTFKKHEKNLKEEKKPEVEVVQAPAEAAAQQPKKPVIKRLVRTVRRHHKPSHP